jgi:hypothetical protein
VIALAGTVAASIAAAGGSWAAMNAEEYEQLAVALARKKRPSLVRAAARGCSETHTAVATIKMLQVIAAAETASLNVTCLVQEAEGVEGVLREGAGKWNVVVAGLGRNSNE